MTTIFTDGASRGNPGPGGWAGIILDDGKVLEIGGREENTTNNRMEMTAAIETLKRISDNSKADQEIQLYTDSAYLLNGITKWVWAWQKNNWQTKTKEEVLNKDLWQRLLEVSKNKKIKWKKLPGHSGVPANERCDVIATSFADDKPIKLFHGDIKNYKIDLSIVKGNEKAIKLKSSKKIKAYSYVSEINGEIEIHKTWAECEARVKGKSGAKFKKTVSKSNEKEIIAEFSK